MYVVYLFFAVDQKSSYIYSAAEVLLVAILSNVLKIPDVCDVLTSLQLIDVSFVCCRNSESP